MKDELSDDSVTESNVEALMKTNEKETGGAITEEAKLRIRGTLEEELSKAPQKDAKLAPVVRIPTRWKALGGGLAIIAAAAGVALFYKPDAPDVEARYQNDELSAKVITLRDGTKAVLAPGAALIEKKPGAVELSKGRAVFDVSAKKAFAVASAVGNAESLGGRFLASVSENEFFVAVARGKVSVDGDGDAEASVTTGNEATVLRGKAPTLREGRLLSHVFAFAEDVTEEPRATPRGGYGNLKARDPQWRVPSQIDSRVFDVDVVVEAGFARTTIDQTYFNPTGRTLEGLYSFQVPHDATISRLAMYVEDTLMEGAVVDRSRGRDIYEGIVERQRDPALLEWMGGDAFRMRLFPIPGRSEKRVFISYTELLEKTYESTELIIPVPDFDLPTRRSSIKVRLRGAKDADVASPSHLFAETTDGSDKVLSFQSEQEIVGKDIVVRYADRGGADGAVDGGKPEIGAFEEDGESFTMVRFAPDLRATQTTLRKPRRYVVLFDVSGSRPKGDLDRQLAFVGGLSRAIDIDDTFEVVAFAHDAAVWSKKEELSAFVEKRALIGGDSRIDLALERTKELTAPASAETMLVYLGDGAFTSTGARIDKDSLHKRVADLGGRFFGVGLGANVDQGLMKTTAKSSGGFVMTLGEEESASRKAFEFLSRTVAPCLYDLRAASTDRSVAVVMLESSTVCDGSEVKALVKSPKGEPIRSISFTATRSGSPWEKTIDVGGTSTSMSFLPRLHAEWRIKTLLEKDPIPAGAAEGPNQKEITELGMKHFLVTPFTSLLVLENDAMYEQYGVKKGEPKGFAVYPAPAKIPVVFEPLGGNKALAVSSAFDIVDRSQRGYFHPTVRDLDDSTIHSGIGLGNIGTIGWGGPMLSGIGEGGGGRGFGSGAIRMGGRLGGGGSRFPGSGRLSGSHRPRFDESRVSTQSIMKGAAMRSRSPRFDRSSDFEGNFVRWGSPVGDDEAWVRLAFSGALLKALESENAPHFLDLTEFARGLFLLPIDEVDVVLGDQVDAAAPDVAMSTFFERVSTKQAQTVLRSKQGEVGVDGAVARRKRHLAFGLVESLVWEGTTVLHRYGDLGFETHRELGAGSALVGSLEGLPLLPPKKALASARLTLVSHRKLRAELPISERADERIPKAIEWTFDSDDRLVSIRHRGGEGFVDQALVWKGSRVTVTRGGDVTTYDVATAGGTTAADSETLLRVEMPLRNPENLEKWIDSLEGEARVSALRQSLATSAATRDEARMVSSLERLIALGRPLTPGEAALGSRALSRGNKKLLAAVDGADPVGAYLRAFEKGSAGSFDAARKVGGGSFMGLLSGSRAAFLDSSAVDKRNRARVLAKEATHAPLLVFAVMQHAVREGTSAQARELWQSALGESDLGLVAARRMAESVDWDEPTKASRDAFERAIPVAIDRGLPVVWDYRVHRVLGYGFRQDSLTDSVRAQMLEKGTGEQLVEWMRMELTEGARDRVSADPYARRLSEVGSTDEKVRAARVLVRANAFEAARSLMADVLAEEAPTVSALIIGARIAEAFGEIDQAIRLRERVIVATKESLRAPEEITYWHLSLLDLTGRRLAQDPRDEARVDAVLNVAARWQADEPDNHEIAEGVALIFFRARKLDLAEAALSAVPEKRPADGAAWSRAARVFVVQGDPTKGLALLDQAVLVEPTNPEWMLERAKLSMSVGERDKSLADFQRVASGKWQPRFERFAEMAKQTLCDLEVRPAAECRTNRGW